MTEKVEVVFLGTAASLPQKNRMQSCTAIRFRDYTLIVDMGEGAQNQIREYKIKTSNKVYILLTHLHADHTIGLVGFLSSRNLLKIEKKITVIGPPGTRRFFYFMFLSFNFLPKFELEIIETEGEIVLNIQDFSIKSFKVRHSSPVNLGYKITFYPTSFAKFNPEKAEKKGIPKGLLWKKLQEGFSVEVDGKKILPSEVLEPRQSKEVRITFSGDTRPCDSLINNAKEVDLLVCDATYPEECGERAEEFLHSTIEEAAVVAMKANCKQVVFTHFSEFYTDFESSLNRARTIFQNSSLAEEGKRIILDFSYNS
ncbi:MAG: ribonuclease Z [Candidatus Heimdallarchaeum endolithica]|uniref:Ribonuclease Z n=1 Tax=Candidatus Heimdallarchaeum endolithica TaxID=2876572 RepID=A0A9Y1FNP2_9ARCH|nr:MAG: ribonuclease Z [Candidatus Heimdallarchaeum endolithica]